MYKADGTGTFSQYDEEIAILKHFRGCYGSFLDVGAWNPKVFSNTRALYELGWSGVMIELSPGPMVDLLKAYGEEGRITLVQGAVGLDDSIVRFQISDDSVTTSNAASYEKWKDTAKFYGQLYVRTITFAQIKLWYGSFDFINLDAEGMSVDLFHEMLRQELKPSCCCVEHDGRTTELAAAATAVGYKAVYVNATNAVFAL
jgi:hypothetical protein